MTEVCHNIYRYHIQIFYKHTIVRAFTLFFSVLQVLSLCKFIGLTGELKEFALDFVYCQYFWMNILCELCNTSKTTKKSKMRQRLTQTLGTILYVNIILYSSESNHDNWIMGFPSSLLSSITFVMQRPIY